mgnify:CR=1 FL=1
MLYPRRILVALPLLALWALSEFASAQPAATLQRPAEKTDETPTLGTQWVRLAKDKAGKPEAMETAIIRYVPRDDFEEGKAADKYAQYVDLVGAVHIGDRAYYGELNRRFRTYDAVLYELVADPGVAIPKGRGASNTHPLGALQNGMKSMLEGEHQLEEIDYTRDNFVHADLSPQEFARSMEQRDEGFLQMFAKIMGASLAHQSQQAARGESADIEFMAALLAEDRARQLKIAMAKQFEEMESLLSVLSGPDGSTLITQRNIRALDVLEEQLKAGQQRLAIFYGAGHLSDMGGRMDKRFDMVPVAVDWVEAWDLR